MAIKIDIATRLRRDGQEEHITAENAGVPPVEIGDKRGLIDMRHKTPARASACIYCGSPEQLSDEHIVPYSLGGDWIIYDGSCEVCRGKTQRFEGLAVRGELSNVRRHLGIHSRSGHKASAESLSMMLTKDGHEIRATIPIDAAPILFAFPTFQEPGYFTDDNPQAMAQTGWQAVSYGRDIEEFLKEHDATGARIAATGYSSPVAFAQMIGKIAYAYAWAEGALEYVEDPKAITRAMLDNTAELGAFVGMRPSPYKVFEGITHRLQFTWHGRGLMVVEVQLFADTGAPTYLVVLGRSTLRQWRRARTAAAGKAIGSLKNGRRL